ncbi:MAG TPA: ATP-grasp domain-containing protein [Candidatus Acidoferrales bacterium]|nr:ATP-grasp domain-containing protein [Candidatus Acidoferrales bacterium]
MKPTVLIAATKRWFPTARLAMALSNAGFTIEAVCLSNHPLEKTSVVRRIYGYDGFAPVTSFANAIAASAPALIVPADEYAVFCLHRLFYQSRDRGDEGKKICALIEESLGPEQTFGAVQHRAPLMKLAAEESIRAPRTAVVTDKAELRKCCEQLLFPIVLKADGTSSGEGVRVARTPEEAERFFRALQAPPSALRAMKRALIDQDVRLILPTLLRQRNTVNAQEFIPGDDATSLAACWKGKVLASLHFEVIKKQHKNGPASVMRRIEIPEMSAAIVKIVGRLKLSGLYGFDFLLERETRDPYLIEMNPRPTQVGHLTLGPGCDLPAALYAELTGTQIQEAPKLTNDDTIALFPQEWMRNPSSAFLRSAYHDIPWEEPELIRVGARNSRNWSAWYNTKKWAALLLADRVPPGNE